MIILESRICSIHRDRDFGMIEARVTLFAKTRAGHPPHPMTVRTHVPARGGNLRARLTADAVRLAKLLAGEVEAPTHAIAA